MFNKIYEKVKSFIRENYLFILLCLIIFATFTYKLPYYIYTGGGLIDVSKKVDVLNDSKISGSYNMCYVSELPATIPTYLFSFFRNDWEVVKKESLTINKNESSSDIKKRDKIFLNVGNNSALINAFKYANKKYEIIKSNPIVVYVMEDANTSLEIGDEIISIDNNNVSNKDDISNYINTLNTNAKVIIKVKNKNKEYERYAYPFKYDNNMLLGISLLEDTTIKTEPVVKFKFKKSEYGSSGGLMLSLAIYDYLVDDDLTKGYKISGTGTIDNDGNVGEIDGVKYKLAGAVKKKAKVFFVPNGSNYNEAIKLKNKKKYNIDIIGVDTFNDALDYLKNM